MIDRPFYNRGVVQMEADMYEKDKYFSMKTCSCKNRRELELNQGAIVSNLIQ